MRRGEIGRLQEIDETDGSRTEGGMETEIEEMVGEIVIGTEIGMVIEIAMIEIVGGAAGGIEIALEAMTGTETEGGMEEETETITEITIEETATETTETTIEMTIGMQREPKLPLPNQNSTESTTGK